MLRSVVILGFVVVIGLFFSVGAYADVVGAWLFDEGSGEVAADSSGRGVDGVVVGGPEWVDGKFGTALNCVTNKYVDFPQPMSEMLIIDRDFTCMAWVEPHEWLGSWNTVFSMQAGSTNGETYGIYFGNNGGAQIMIWTRIAGSGISATSGQGTLDLNVWTHCAITYDGSSMIVYKNGEQAGEAAISGDLDNADGKGRFAINGNYNSLDGTLQEWCSSTIDEVLVFDNVLTPEEIQEYMNNGFSAGQAVEPSAKLSTTWGELKASQ